MILVTFEFNHLATLAIMLVCPVCKYIHREEISNCQRCNWSMQDNLDSTEISPEHPILKTCIPNLVKCLEDETKTKNGLLLKIQMLDPDNQKANNQKLDEIIDAIEESQKQQNELFIQIKSLMENENYYSKVNQDCPEQIVSTESSQLPPIKLDLPSFISRDKQDVKIENNNSNLIVESQSHINKSTAFSEFVGDEKENKIYGTSTKSDLDTNIDSNLISNYEENGLYNPVSDRKNHESNDTQEDTAPEVNSSGSYQSFYHLIRNGKIEVTKVALTQETMEKMRIGTLSELIFSNDHKGNYWIVNWKDVYCLIPKENININQYQYGNFQKVFDCQNYQETSKDFEVVEPTTVLKGDGETWQLERKGKIKFI